MLKAHTMYAPFAVLPIFDQDFLTGSAMGAILKDITIVQAFLHNLPELQDIARKTFAESFAAYNTPEDMQHYLEVNLGQAQLELELSEEGSFFYLVKKEGILIGYLKINSTPGKEAAHTEKGFELERIYLLKAYQQHGIGQLLFDFAKSMAAESGADYLWLGVWEQNTGAIRFYERNGMQQFGAHSFMLGKDRQTDILMRLNV